MWNHLGKVKGQLLFNMEEISFWKIPPSFVAMWFVLSATLAIGVGSVGAQLLSDRIHLSGYGSMHALDHGGMPRLVGRDNPNDLIFQMREFSLFFDFDVTEGIFASLELQAVSNATEVQPAYAYIDIDIPTYLPYWNEDVLGGLSFRAGRLLVPFLSYNENKAMFKQNLMSPPFTAESIVPVIPRPPDFDRIGWSDVGFTLNWFREVGDLGLVDVKFSIIGGLGSDSDVFDDNTVTLAAGAVTPTVRPRDGFQQNTQFDIRDNNQGKATVLKVTMVPSGFPVDLGVSWYRGSWDPDGTQLLQMVGLHGNWLDRDWNFKFEWVRAFVEQNEGINVVTAPGPPTNASTDDYDASAWYVEGSYIPLRWGPADNRWLRLILRYDELDTNDEVAFNALDRYRITPGLELQFASNIRARFEWQHHTIRDFRKAPGAFKAAGGERIVNMYMFAMVFWF